MENTHEHENLRQSVMSFADSEQLKIRCPECLKLYAVHTREIHETRPRFECVDCQTKFWISFSEALDAREEILGFPLSWLDEREAKAPITREVSLKAFSCQKCGHSYTAGDTECVKCGVVFLQFKERPRTSEELARASVEVREAWEAVLSDYENLERHQKFISAALTDRSLPYASRQYGRILEVCPHDANAERAQKEISALAFARFESAAVRTKEPHSSLFSGLDFSFRKIRITSYILFMCGIVIGMGLFLPHQRNLVGVGTAVMFFILALRYYFRVI